ncbi:hypothetical protein Lser_V15G44366 [Lactuca serriola]
MKAKSTTMMKTLAFLKNQKMEPHRQTPLSTRIFSILTNSPETKTILKTTTTKTMILKYPRTITRTNLYLFSSWSGSRSSWSPSPALSEKLQVDQVDNKVLSGKEDKHGGVIVEMSAEPIDPLVFTSLLKASMLHLKQQGKRGIWIKLPIRLVNLIELVVKEGFYFHHAEPKHMMLVNWIPETTNTLPAGRWCFILIGS